VREARDTEVTEKIEFKKFEGTFDLT
jgi:hypothetical protein